MLKVRNATVLLLAMSLLLAARPALAQTRITLGYLPSNAFLAAYVAKDQGFFARHGLDVSFDLVPQAALLRRALAEGNIQVATLNVPALLRVDDDRAGLLIVAAATRQTADHSTAGILAGRDSKIHAAADFRGRRVGVPGLNGINHLVFMQWLQDQGVDPRTVRYVAVLLPQMADQLKAGRIDAAIPVEPFLDRIVKSGGGTLVAGLPAAGSPPYLEAAYAMRRSWLQGHPQAAAEFRESLRDALRWIADKPQEARRLQMRYLKIAESAALSAPLPELAVDVSAADVQYWIDLCRRFGVTRGRVATGDVLAD